MCFLFSKAWPRHLFRFCVFAGSDLVQSSVVSVVLAAFGSVLNLFYERHVVACTAVLF